AAGSLPDFSFIVPNLCDDAHDCSLNVADIWLKTNIDPLIKNSAFQKDGLLIVVFDESGNDNTHGGGRVVAALVSPAFSKAGYSSTTLYQHQSVLRLILEGLGVKTLPASASSAPVMWEFFAFVPPAQEWPREEKEVETRASKRKLARRRYLISRISFSFTADRSSIFLVSACAIFSSSSSARFCSSWLIFLSFSSLSMASLMSRRMLRTAVRWFSS